MAVPVVNPSAYPGATWYQGWGFWYLSPDGSVNNAYARTADATNPYTATRAPSAGLPTPTKPAVDTYAAQLAAAQKQQALRDAAQKEADQKDAFDYITTLLGEYDMDSLSDWAWEQIVQGNSAEQVIQSMRKQQEYLDRFQGMAIRRQLGLNAMSEAEYISYERRAQQMMRAAGMPAGFWDNQEDFANLIGHDISPEELNQRITNAYVRVANAPVEVRNAFTSFFGPDGDAAFAAYFLDPDRALPMLESAINQAEIAGTGARFGIGVNQGMAAQLAGIGVDLKQATEGFGQIALQPGLYQESITEAQDYTMEKEGVEGQFGVDMDAALALQRRRDERQAAFSAPVTQVTATQQGLVGLGSARQ